MEEKEVRAMEDLAYQLDKFARVGADLSYLPQNLDRVMCENKESLFNYVNRFAEQVEDLQMCLKEDNEAKKVADFRKYVQDRSALVANLMLCVAKGEITQEKAQEIYLNTRCVGVVSGDYGRYDSEINILCQDLDRIEENFLQINKLESVGDK